MNALANDIKLIHRKLSARSRLCVVALAFSLGAASGIYGTLSISASCAAQAPRTISGTVLGVGEHLCKEHEGLSNVKRVGEEAYAFSCRELAEFPRVSITVAKKGE